MDKKEIIFTGLGGQGIVKSGVILAEAAVLEGKHVVQTQNYGPESRGGCCRADVIIADQDISYPRVNNADIILALSQKGLEKFKDCSKPEAMIIADETLEVGDIKNCRKFNIIKYTEEILKNPQAINMLCLGILASVTNLVSYDALKKAICDNVPKSSIDKNLLAFQAGIDMTEQTLKN
ncbi:2-oxoacid:acceptor oxidoreductase family protein [Clostridium amazonitimonense]|uniref:2-oxoacid:acceptor oxidoreductase family protein n=1 Tax=Clostridium amazonitimonense TaxID=1499689 RepID=UPI0005096B72|nr:2-oxoacid:acceptor oxidoreductase family protein [Clostridium amazonitimonense]